MTEVTFVPKMIGTTNEEKFEEVHSLYEKLINAANCLCWDFEGLTKKTDPATTAEFFEIIKMNDQTLSIYLKRLFVKAENIKMDGIDIERMLELDLITLPEEYRLILQEKRIIDEVANKIDETYFQFSLTKLFDKDSNEFVLTDEFENDLHMFTTYYTQNEDQNKAIDVVERFCEILNDFIDLDIIKSQGSLWQNIGSILSDSIINDKSGVRPLKPDPKMFLFYPFRKFHFTNPLLGRSKNITKILS